MKEIFNYSSLSANLAPRTKSLIITLKREYLDLETVFELETIFAWCSSKLEIKSILLTSIHDTFSKGVTEIQLARSDEKTLQKIYKKMQKIVTALSCLPQTVVLNLKGGAENIAIDLALAADLKIAKQNTILHFNHLELGLTPVGTSSYTLQNNFGAQIIKNALFSGLKLSGVDLRHLGCITGANTDTILKNISKQSSMARIQSKAMLNSKIMKDIDEIAKTENAFASASIHTGDWKNKKFKNAKTFKSDKAEEFDALRAPDRFL